MSQIIANKTADDKSETDNASLRKAEFGRLYTTAGKCNAERRWEEAEALYRRAISIKPDFAGTHNNLGNVYKAVGRVPAAMACFNQALALDPENVGVLNNLAICHKHTGDVESAVSCYRKAIEINPEIPTIHYNLGNVLVAAGRRSSR